MKIIKKNIIGFIIGGIIFGSISVTIASQILATQVSYTYEDSPNNVTNVSAALTELYGLAEECQNANSGEIQYKGKDAEAVYLDPTGTQTNCSSSNFSSTASTGCFRFYVYAEDGKYRYAILDHNTTANVSSFYIAQSQVKEDTKDWNPNYQARNISAMEVYKITESTNNYITTYGTNWQINNGNWFYFYGNNGRNYGWLFDRTDGCQSYGCTTNDSSTQGYWTSDARDSSNAWYVGRIGSLDNYSFSSSSRGVRPVIQIIK